MANVMAALPNIGGAVQSRKVMLTPTTRLPYNHHHLFIIYYYAKRQHINIKKLTHNS